MGTLSTWMEHAATVVSGLSPAFVPGGAYEDDALPELTDLPVADDYRNRVFSVDIVDPGEILEGMAIGKVQRLGTVVLSMRYIAEDHNELSKLLADDLGKIATALERPGNYGDADVWLVTYRGPPSIDDAEQSAKNGVVVQMTFEVNYWTEV